MNASRIAAAAAFMTILTAGGHGSAQSFDTSPQYDAYSPGQTVPRVNLPRPVNSSDPVGRTTSERQDTLPTVRSEQPRAGTPTRRTDAGALSKTRETSGKAPAGPVEKTGTAPAPSTEQKYPAGTVLEGSVSVYDGQNIVVEGVPVRFDGAEAPALAQQCMTRKGLVWNCGGRAAEKLRNFVASGKVRCVVTEPLGAGAAAICSAQGISDLGAAMIGEGLAVSNGHDKGRYAMQQTVARSAGRGMWIGPFEAPWTWRARHGQ
ncbi:hypothetical protein G6L37_02145 [Agrobacterium rubi]|nr:hypothetical protein [Agrobacterium rubi]NTF24195.1 hypothetical protein [Agrobacterium rubi]